MLSALVLALMGAPAAAEVPTPAEIEAAAPAADWMALPPAELLVMELSTGGRVVIALAAPYAPTHVANIRRLVKDGWFERNAAIVRVQDNYVVQWGDPTAKAPLPEGIEARPADGYDRPGLPAGFRPLPFPDVYARTVGHAAGWPVATDGQAHWLPHCPSMVGVGRDMPPDTGTGAELYAVIGHGPRHLDRNIALVGRVVSGMERLSALPRGTGTLGFYEQPAERVGIRRMALAADLPADDRPRIEVLRTDSGSFARWVDARANRRDAFFVRPAGAADICNLLPPVRDGKAGR
jgi:peptidylprolyl isomerase